jgi:hypothetical protein
MAVLKTIFGYLKDKTGSNIELIKNQNKATCTYCMELLLLL